MNERVESILLLGIIGDGEKGGCDFARIDCVACGVDHANGVLLVAQIDTDGDTISIRPKRHGWCYTLRNGGGGRSDGPIR